MKRLIYFAVVIMTCLFGITCFSSCLNDDEDVDVVKNIIVEVDSAPCDVYVELGEPTTLPGMSIKEEKSQEWQKVSQTRIIGFTYEPGYYYTLKVKKTILANPPADGSSITYALIEVVSKDKK